MKHPTLWLVTALSVLALFATASAKTPDGLTPAVEQVCTNAGLTGALWGLCNAYCEAMDCDSPAPHADPQACQSVYDNFVKQSGGYGPPCLWNGELWPDE